ncbi:hypothetical protein DPMN_003920 [Dreissena polymorpha]|uniref:Uncharacterized protein n=1 Tax=Dreissena polymorpha TaxID=45954 RepID=A0A9D4MMN0_DREPO|nr:hypothetical protein DPMN_003920 [Dreissena polymorpha]
MNLAGKEKCVTSQDVLDSLDWTVAAEVAVIAHQQLAPATQAGVISAVRYQTAQGNQTVTTGAIVSKQILTLHIAGATRAGLGMLVRKSA